MRGSGWPVVNQWHAEYAINSSNKSTRCPNADESTAVSIMRELVEHLQDTTEALKREIVRNPKSDEYRKALKGTGERLTIAKQILAREEARASHSP
jgi:hypothetical protein